LVFRDVRLLLIFLGLPIIIPIPPALLRCDSVVLSQHASLYGPLENRPNRILQAGRTE